MQSSTKVMATFFILVVLIAGLYFFSDWFSRVTGYALGEEEKISLAQCLTGQGSVLYVSGSCKACDEQRALFGERASEFLVENKCVNNEDCPALNGFPAWRIKGEFYYGVQSLRELSKISECAI